MVAAGGTAPRWLRRGSASRLGSLGYAVSTGSSRSRRAWSWCSAARMTDERVGRAADVRRRGRRVTSSPAVAAQLRQNQRHSPERQLPIAHCAWLVQRGAQVPTSGFAAWATHA